MVREFGRGDIVIRYSSHLVMLFTIVGTLFFSAANAGSKEIKINHGNLILNAELHLSDGKALKDGVVLMVHGTLAHNGMDTIKNLAAVLNERNFNTLAINLSLGIDNRHGMYDCRVPHRHKHLDALDEIAAWFDWLEAQGAGDVALLGHSRGGNQVTRFAAERGHYNLISIIMLAPSQGGGRSPKSYEKAHGKSLNEILRKAKGLVKTGKGSQILSGTDILYCPGSDVAAETFVSYYNQDPRADTVNLLPDLNIPSLVIVGGNDTVVRGLPERMKSIADGRRLVLAVVEDADHFFLDLFAEDVADHIEKFVFFGS